MRGVKHVRRWEAELVNDEAVSRERIPLRRSHPAASDDRTGEGTVVDVPHYLCRRSRDRRRQMVATFPEPLELSNLTRQAWGRP